MAGPLALTQKIEVRILGGQPKMSKVTVFPVLLIILAIVAGVVYAFDGNVRLAIYWFGVAVINTVITF